MQRITDFVAWLLDARYDVRLLTGDREDEAVAAMIRNDLGRAAPISAPAG